jgi:nicotinate-nucleotide adenylyltransferase
MYNPVGNPMKITVLGGSFDPIHLGHLHLADQVLKMNKAEEVWFVPAGNHRFKQANILLDFDNRISLINQCIKSEPRFKCLDIDRAGMGDGSTYDIMQKLKQQYPTYDFSFVIGMDNMAQLPQWFKFDWLKDNVRFLLAVRPGYSPDPDVIAKLKDFTYLNCPPNSISSSDIKQRLVNGLGIQGMVPHHVLIEITRLYKELLKKKL